MAHVLAKDLREAILNAAVQGKLTNRCSSDSNVHVLFSSIADEKRKYKTKLKSSEPLSIDDCDLDIPDSWMWCRLQDVCNNITAGGDKPKDFVKTKDSKHIYPVVANGVENDGILGYTETPTAKSNTITVAGRGTIGFSVYRNYKYCPIVRLIVIEQSSLMNPRYIQLFLRAFPEKSVGTSIPQLTVPMIAPKPFPLPPIEEQARIVARVDELMAKIDEYEKLENELVELKKNFSVDMKAAVLQAAMQGKLTEQLESDGNVYEYFDFITQKRKELIKEKQLKKESCLDSPIDETPFDIPDSWKWCYLGECIQLTSGADLTPDRYNDKGQGTVYITGASNIENGKVIVNRWTESPRSIAKKDDLLLTCKGTVGTTCFLDLDEAHIARQIMSIRPIDVHPRYINAFISYYVNQLKAMAKSMIPGIERKNVLTALFPLPPIEEQQRIVDKLDQLLPLVESLEIS